MREYLQPNQRDIFPWEQNNIIYQCNQRTKGPREDTTEHDNFGVLFISWLYRFHLMDPIKSEQELGKLHFLKVSCAIDLYPLGLRSSLYCMLQSS